MVEHKREGALGMRICSHNRAGYLSRALCNPFRVSGVLWGEATQGGGLSFGEGLTLGWSM